jgi:hypothetical protein
MVSCTEVFNNFMKSNYGKFHMNISVIEDYDFSYCSYLGKRIKTSEKEIYDLEQLSLQNKFKIVVRKSELNCWNGNGTYTGRSRYRISK